ncbi:MAG: YebC/PmpR family DNA-binding transcriptional regulator [Candidatus Shapirobacteria bacterium]|jgi:YebC/PmpR family DNA-binding regulatory protein
MSGHSKWANIKNRKGSVDKKRSETFTKLARGIITAIRQDSGLKTAIEKARMANMPKDNIDRLLSSFAERQKNLISLTLEGYAISGVPMIIELETDNKNRSLSEIKLIIKTHGGSLGEEGSVAYLFDRLMEMEVERELSDLEQLEMIDLGVVEIDGVSLFMTKDRVPFLKEKMVALGIEINSLTPIMKVKLPLPITDEEVALKIADLVEELEEHQDVVAVHLGGEYVEKT